MAENSDGCNNGGKWLTGQTIAREHRWHFALPSLVFPQKVGYFLRLAKGRIERLIYYEKGLALETINF